MFRVLVSEQFVHLSSALISLGGINAKLIIPPFEDSFILH